MRQNISIKRIVILIVICLLIILLGFVIYGINKSPHVKYLSPNEENIITVYDLNGGATTGFYTVIKIMKKGRLFTSKKVLVAGDYDVAKVVVRWIDEENVHIFLGPGNPEKMLNKWQNVNIQYN